MVRLHAWIYKHVWILIWFDQEYFRYEFKISYINFSLTLPNCMIYSLFHGFEYAVGGGWGLLSDLDVSLNIW